MSEDDRLKLPTFNELKALDEKALIDRIDAMIWQVEVGPLSTAGGADKAAVILRAQYIMQELGRRTQARQTRTMKNYSLVVALMAILIMATRIWPVVWPLIAPP